MAPPLAYIMQILMKPNYWQIKKNFAAVENIQHEGVNVAQEIDYSLNDFEVIKNKRKNASRGSSCTNCANHINCSSLSSTLGVIKAKAVGKKPLYKRYLVIDEHLQRHGFCFKNNKPYEKCWLKDKHGVVLIYLREVGKLRDQCFGTQTVQQMIRH